MTLDFDPIDEATSNWRAAHWPAVEAMAVATSITRAQQILVAHIDEALAPLGLNLSRFEVLALLSFTQEGHLPMGKIGVRLQVHPASVTNTVDRLQSDGLVVRVPHPFDGRATLAEITATGRHYANEGAHLLGAIEFGVGGMGVGQRAGVVKALATMRAAAGDFPAEHCVTLPTTED